jgi:peptide/nickel transport system substrate-binding protein
VPGRDPASSSAKGGQRMSDAERTERWWAVELNRRTLLRGGVLGGAGLAAAALIGCGDDDDDDDDDDTTSVAPTSAADDSGTDDAATDDGADETPAGEGLLVQDEAFPYPYQFPEPGGLTPKPGGTMTVGATFSLSTLDPTKSAAGGTITVPNMVYNRLLGMVGGVQKDPFTIELKPELASSWERSPDGAVWTFDIRQDVNWQNIAPLNGRPFTAQDAKYAFERYAEEGVHQSYWANVGSIEAVDDHTLQITMSKVTADFILPIASRYQTIFPRETVEDGSIEQNVVGTGPMILKAVESGAFAKFEKNPDYFEREVLLDGIDFQIVSDPSARTAGLRVGQYDYTYGTPANKTELEALLGTNPDLQVNLNPINYASPFGMNLSNPKFQDERVRQAMSLALDTDLMIDVVYDGWAKTFPVQPWTFVFDEEPTPESGLMGNWVRYDPDEAKKLLSAAGAEGLSFDSIYYNYSIAYDRTTEIIIDNFSDVGLDINSQRVDYTQFNSTWVPGKLEEATTSGWLTVGFDADNYFFNSVHSQSPGNRWRLNDPQVDAWAEEQQVELDPEARREKLRVMWDYFLDKMYYPPMPGAIGIYVYQPWVRGIRFGGINASNSYYYDWGHQIAGAWLDK